jgi:hypothetical protein
VRWPRITAAREGSLNACSSSNSSSSSINSQRGGVVVVMPTCLPRMHPMHDVCCGQIDAPRPEMDAHLKEHSQNGTLCGPPSPITI